MSIIPDEGDKGIFRHLANYCFSFKQMRKTLDSNHCILFKTMLGYIMIVWLYNDIDFLNLNSFSWLKSQGTGLSSYFEKDPGVSLN